MKKYFKSKLCRQDAKSMHISPAALGLSSFGGSNKLGDSLSFMTVNRVCYNEHCRKFIEIKRKQKIVCKRCKCAFYCSRKCQKISWKFVHRFKCFDCNNVKIKMK